MGGGGIHKEPSAAGIVSGGAGGGTVESIVQGSEGAFPWGQYGGGASD